MYMVHLDDIHHISLFLPPIQQLSLSSSPVFFMCVHVCMHVCVCIGAGLSEGQRLHHDAFLSRSHSYFSSVSY